MPILAKAQKQVLTIPWLFPFHLYILNKPAQPYECNTHKSASRPAWSTKEEDTRAKFFTYPEMAPPLGNA
jgi:hypothetical protein